MDHQDYSEVLISLTDPVRQLFMTGIVWLLGAETSSRPLSILEVGSWTGGSALTWGEALIRYSAPRGRLTCVDLWEPFSDIDANRAPFYAQADKALKDGIVFESFLKNIAPLQNEIDVDVRKGDSARVMASLPSASFDIVYLDGNHTYPAVRADIINGQSLVRDGGIICGDDLEIQAADINDEVAIESPNIDYMALPGTKTWFHPGVTLAVGEILGHVSSWEGFWAMRKVQGNWQPVTLTGMPFHVPRHLPPAARAKIETVVKGRERL
jgi:predicted O-methyltransferase YrrM